MGMYIGGVQLFSIRSPRHFVDNACRHWAPMWGAICIVRVEVAQQSQIVSRPLAMSRRVFGVPPASLHTCSCVLVLLMLFVSFEFADHGVAWEGVDA